MKKELSIQSIGIIFILLFSILACINEVPNSNKNSRPNILLIVADDLGFTDLGCYGSEIKTPNIDDLAQQGTRFTSFCTAPTCSPSRAMLLSGVVAHRNGYGTMEGDWADNQIGLKGYEGHLNFDVVTFPKLLQDAGYHTSIAGKWHQAFPAKTKKQWAINRGFTYSYCLMQGGAGHFYDKQPLLSFIEESIYTQDSNYIGALPKDFYSSKNYADKSIAYINESKQAGKPFFHFLSFTAPHWPLQIPDEYADLYKGKYDKGYEELAKQRFEKGKTLNVIPENTSLPPLSPNVLPWSELSKQEQQSQSRSMEIYAAMIERLDFHTGRVIQHLKSIGVYENTLILFIADNGAEGNSIMGYEGTGEWVDKTFDNSLENMGKQNSYIELGAGWGQVCSLPFKWYKAFATEGGIRVPAIIHYPKRFNKLKTIEHGFVSIMDLAPTFLDLANVQHPQTTYEGRAVFSMNGKSMLPFLDGEKSTVHPTQEAHVWELYGRRGVRKGKWKAEWLEPPYGNNQWELYDLSDDIAQQNNLAEQNQEKLNELISDWNAYAETNSVTLPDRPTAYAKEKNWRE